MVAARLIERGPGLGRVLAAIDRLKGRRVKVGILASAGTEKGSDLTVAAIGAIHEFGSPEHGIPERSFLRAGIIENTDKILAVAQKVGARVIAGTLEPEQALGIVGQFAADRVKAKIVSGPFAPNAPSTIAAKGSTSPLIDTGQLRQSITWAIADASETGV